MLKLTEICKDYGDVRVLDHVSLEIQEGEFFSILGPSGCGKTTLLRIIGGFLEPDEGRVELRGEDITAFPPERRHFNTVFQSYALFPHLNVFNNVAFGLKIKKTPQGEIDQRVVEALTLVKMQDQADRTIQTLSGGQMQRVALARALVNRPQILLLDEPLSALDLKLRLEMQIELKQLQRRLNHTFIYVTHDQGEAMTLSDRIAVMNKGKLLQVGAPQDIYRHPANAFVANFIGTANLIGGVLEQLDGPMAILRMANNELIYATRNGLQPGDVKRSYQVLVRPEHIHVATNDGTPGRYKNNITAKVVDISFKGPVTRLEATPEIPAVERVAADLTYAARDAVTALTGGSPVRLSFSWQDASLIPDEQT